MVRNILIVGSGIGGLSLALRLAKRGHRIKILEKHNKAGGRLNQISKDGFTFDTGPSFFSMSYEFEQFARECNIKLPFKYKELEPLYTVNFAGDSKTYLLYKDLKKLAEQFKDIEPDFELKMRNYLMKCQKVFDDTVDVVIKNNFDSLLDYFLSLIKVNPIHLPLLMRSFWQQVSKNFSSKEARQIISLVAFFLGRTPFDTMAVYTLLSYTEFMHDGYYNVEGGMYKIVEGLLSELKKENVEIFYDTEIIDYESSDRRLISLIDKNHNRWQADVFAINADALVFRSKVLKRPRYTEQNLDKMEWTMGYLTFYIGLKTKLPRVHHHNYFLGTNYEEFANKVITDISTLEKPYYYVNVVSKYNENCAPEGCESLFFVCPVPNLIYKKNWDDKEKIVESIINDFSKRIGINIKEDIVLKIIFTPEDWQNKFNLYKGSGLGLAHTFNQIGYFRPKNFDEEFKNLFYVGASTVPGAGLPMGIISSKLAYERIERYLNNYM